jgi:hypothetical protein
MSDLLRADYDDKAFTDRWVAGGPVPETRPLRLPAWMTRLAGLCARRGSQTARPPRPAPVGTANATTESSAGLNSGPVIATTEGSAGLTAARGSVGPVLLTDTGGAEGVTEERDEDVEVRESRIHGHGLFARRDLPAGTLIDARYVQRMNDPFSFAAFNCDSVESVNRWLDQYDDVDRVTHTTNCRLVRVTGRVFGWSTAVQVVRDVPAGDELVRWYGHAYWLNHFMKILPFYALAIGMETEFGDSHTQVKRELRRKRLDKLPLIEVAITLPDKYSREAFLQLRQLFGDNQTPTSHHAIEHKSTIS